MNWYEGYTIEELARKYYTVGGYTDCNRNRVLREGVKRFGTLEFDRAMNKALGELTKQYPQGWQYYPGDTCRHGTYLDPERDCCCAACEMGED